VTKVMVMVNRTEVRLRENMVHSPDERSGSAICIAVGDCLSTLKSCSLSSFVVFDDLHSFSGACLA